jgi:hypothetical protein
MIDLYAIIAIAFGVLGYYISGGMPMFLMVIGIGIGIIVGVTYLFLVKSGVLFTLAVLEEIRKVLYKALKVLYKALWGK